MIPFITRGIFVCIAVLALALPAAADDEIGVSVTEMIPEQQFGAGRIELQGEGFGNSGSVIIGGSRAPINFWNESKIIVRVPASLPAGRYPLQLRIGGKTVFERSLLVKPRIVDVSVTTDKSGTAIRVAGTSLLGITLKVGGIEPRFVSRSNQELVMSFPPELVPGIYRLKIDVAGHWMESSEFEIPKLEVPLTLSIDAIEFRGTQLQIQGAVRGATGLNPPTVMIDGKPVTIAEWKPTFILVDLPMMEPGEHVIAFSSGGMTSDEKGFRLVFPTKAPKDPRWDETEFEDSDPQAASDAL